MGPAPAVAAVRAAVRSVLAPLRRDSPRVAPLGGHDRRVLVAAPLVCHLIGPPKRHFDPDSAIATSLLIAVPPVGGVLIVAERAMDGLYWLRRKFD